MEILQRALYGILASAVSATAAFLVMVPLSSVLDSGKSITIASWLGIYGAIQAMVMPMVQGLAEGAFLRKQLLVRLQELPGCGGPIDMSEIVRDANRLIAISSKRTRDRFGKSLGALGRVQDGVVWELVREADRMLVADATQALRSTSS